VRGCQAPQGPRPLLCYKQLPQPVQPSQCSSASQPASAHRVAQYQVGLGAAEVGGAIHLRPAAAAASASASKLTMRLQPSWGHLRSLPCPPQHARPACMHARRSGLLQGLACRPAPALRAACRSSAARCRWGWGTSGPPPRAASAVGEEGAGNRHCSASSRGWQPRLPGGGQGPGSSTAARCGGERRAVVEAGAGEAKGRLLEGSSANLMLRPPELQHTAHHLPLQVGHLQQQTVFQWPELRGARCTQLRPRSGRWWQLQQQAAAVGQAGACATDPAAAGQGVGLGPHGLLGRRQQLGGELQPALLAQRHGHLMRLE
jgi:hypothetical protein